MRSWARDLAFGVLLAAAVPAAPVLAAQSAEQILLDKANYWRLKDRPDLAVEALQQLLSINPNQPDALYQYGIIDVQQGKLDDAKGYLGRLRKAAPSSPRVADLENAIRAGQVSPSELSEARRLAQSGQFSQAAEKYQQTFKGAPPPTFGVEYYMTLAGTPDRYPEARRGLEQLVQNSPNDSKAKLALAEVLTYRADTRNQGIKSLVQLSDDPVVGQQATEAWKKSLMWLGNTPEEQKLYNEYLAKVPQDAELRQHIAEAAKQGTGGGPSPGYSDLNRGNLAAAERQFEAELRRNPNDASALAGLGIVRLRQRRLPQARELLKRAIAEYRRVLASTPDDKAAQAGLRGALIAERSAETAGVPGPGAATPVNPTRARADALRAQGQQLEAQGDIAGAGARFQEAIAVDPTDPWARLDYARFLARRGDATQGFAIVDPAASGNTAESLYAAALFYNEMNRPAEALALLDRIPPGSRTADMTALHERIVVTAELEHAKQLAKSGNRAAARNVLLALNSRPPHTIDKTFQIANALADIGFTRDALELARPGAAAARDRKVVLDYAALLTKAGHDGEAAAWLAQVEGAGRIGPNDRQELEHTKGDIAAKRADALRMRGDLAGAYDQISPLLSAYPNEPTLLMAAGRIYASAGASSIAMRFFDAAFRQAPGDLGVIRGAVGGAIQAGDLARARAYLSYGMQLYPNNPRLFYLQAELAHASGDNGRALYDLHVARNLDNPQAGAVEPLPPLPTLAPGSLPAQGTPGGLPPNPFRRMSDAASKRPVQLAAATPVVASDATPGPLSEGPSTLHDAAVSADSDDLVVPPRAGERPPRPAASGGAATVSRSAQPLPPRDIAAPPASEIAAAPGAGYGDTVDDPAASASRTRHTAQMQSYPGYQQGNYPTYQPAAYPQYQQQQPAYPPYPQPATTAAPSYPQPYYPPSLQPVATPAQSYAPSYYPQYQPAPAARSVPQPAARQYQQAAPTPLQTYPAATSQQYPPPGAIPLQPLPPPPIPGYQSTAYPSQAGPAPQDSLELDIERSMAAIAAETGPTIQGGFGFRGRSGEDGLSRLDEITTPIEGIFSPFYTGTARLQAIPTYLTAGNPALTSLPRFGREALIALNPAATPASLIPAGDQTAGGVSLNAAYAYQIFSGEIGTTPLGFPVENLVGRLALTWPPPAQNTTALPTIPLAPVNPSNPWRVVAEGVRKPVTESVLSYAGTKDPLTGQTWGGVIRTGGDVLVSYDDGDVGFYAGGGFWSVEGKSVANNTEAEGIIGAYVRPYRVGSTALKIGANLNFMGYDKNLRFFTFGQGGYFSPQNYINFSVPVEYSGRSGRLTYLVGGALGVENFHENRSPFFPTEPGNQAALQNTFGAGAFYPARSVTGLSFAAKGQLEYQLDNGFAVGALASFDNAQNYNEGIGKLYLRKNFAPVAPSTALLPHSLPGSL